MLKFFSKAGCGMCMAETVDKPSKAPAAKSALPPEDLPSKPKAGGAQNGKPAAHVSAAPAVPPAPSAQKQPQNGTAAAAATANGRPGGGAVAADAGPDRPSSGLAVAHSYQSASAGEAHLDHEALPDKKPRPKSGGGAAVGGLKSSRSGKSSMKGREEGSERSETDLAPRMKSARFAEEPVAEVQTFLKQKEAEKMGQVLRSQSAKSQKAFSQASLVASEVLGSPNNQGRPESAAKEEKRRQLSAKSSKSQKTFDLSKVDSAGASLDDAGGDSKPPVEEKRRQLSAKSSKSQKTFNPIHVEAAQILEQVAPIRPPPPGITDSFESDYDDDHPDAKAAAAAAKAAEEAAAAQAAAAAAAASKRNMLSAKSAKSQKLFSAASMKAAEEERGGEQAEAAAAASTASKRNMLSAKSAKSQKMMDLGAGGGAGAAESIESDHDDEHPDAKAAAAAAQASKRNMLSAKSAKSQKLFSAASMKAAAEEERAEEDRAAAAHIGPQGDSFESDYDDEYPGTQGEAGTQFQSVAPPPAPPPEPSKRNMLSAKSAKSQKLFSAANMKQSLADAEGDSRQGTLDSYDDAPAPAAPEPEPSPDPKRRMLSAKSAKSQKLFGAASIKQSLADAADDVALMSLDPEEAPRADE